MAKQFNFIDSKGVGYNQLPLNVSTTSDKVDKSQKTAQDIIKEVANGADFTNGNPEGLTNIIGNQSVKDKKFTVEEAEKYLKYGVMPSGYVEDDVLNKSRAMNQAKLEQFGRMLGQATVNEVILGTVRGFSDIFDAAINSIKGFTFDDYSNPVSKELEDLQNQVRENWAIYQEDESEGFHMGDFGWWMNGTVNAATTLSLMLPGLGISKGVSLLGKIPVGRGISLGGKIDRIGIKAAQKLSKANSGRLYKTAKDATEVGFMALMSRTAENYQEARETYNIALEKAKNDLASMDDAEREEFYTRNPQYRNKPDDEVAKSIASVSAGETFANDYWMLLMDIPQFKALKPIWKGAGAGRMGSVATTRAVRKANKEALEKLTKGTLTEASVEAASKKFSKDAFKNAFRLENIGKNAKDFFTRTEGLMLGEAVEEGFQGIQSEKGREIGEMYFNPTLVQKTLGDYLQDESIWEQAFWGMFGGLLFQAGAKGFRRLEDNLRAKIKSDKLTDNEIKALKAGQDKARVEEIQGRFAKMEDYKNKMALVNNGRNPYSPIRNEDGTVRLNDNKEVVYNLLESEDDVNRIKTQLTRDFITDLAIDAVDTGNYDLLKEFVSQPEFAKYFEEVGLENDKVFEAQLLQDMDQIAKDYQNTYYDVITNADAYNEYITRAVARNIVKRKQYINAINDTISEIDSKLSEENISDIDKYYKETLKFYITQKIAAYKKAIDKLEQTKANRNNFLSNQAYKYQLKDYAQQINRLYKELNAIDDRFSQINISAEEGVDLNKVLKEAEALYNEFLINFGIVQQATTTLNNLSERIQDLLGQKAVYELEKIQNELYLPRDDNAKKYYQEEYDNQESMYIDLAKSKFGIAWDRISKFIQKSENPYETVQHLLKDDILQDDNLNKHEKEVLQDALEILRFGSKDRQIFTQTLDLMLSSEVQRRKKEQEDREKINTSGEEVEVKPEPSKSQPATNVSSTGKAQQTPTKEKTEIAPNAVVSEGPEYIPEEIPDNPVEGELNPFIPDFTEEVPIGLTPEEEAILNDDGVYTINDERANKITSDAIRKNRSIYEQILKDGINSEAGTQLLDIIKNELLTQGLEPALARQYALSGLRGFLSIEKFKSRKKNNDRIDKILDDIYKLYSIYDEEEMSLSDKEKTIEEIFENFLNANGVVKTEIDGKGVVDLKFLFEKLAALFDKENVTYEKLLNLYRDIERYIDNRQINLESSPYIFVNKNFLHKSQAYFVQQLYESKTKRDPINPFKHFKATLDSELNETLDEVYAKGEKYANAFLLELLRYARDKKVTFKKNKNNIQILIKYDGNNKQFAKEKGKVFELGIISTVKKNKDNTKLTSRYNGIEIIAKLEKDGNVSTTFDKILNECLNNDKLYETLKHQYIYQNYTYFSSEADKYKNKPVTYEEIKEFLNNAVVKEFADQQGIKLTGFKSENEKQETINAFTQLFNKITSILFYQFNTKRNTEDSNYGRISTKQGIAESLDKFRRKVYDDFLQTDKIQSKLDAGEELESSLKSDDVGKITFSGESFSINGRGFGGKEVRSHPFIIMEIGQCVDEYGKVYEGIQNGEHPLRGVGILIGENQGIYDLEDVDVKRRSGANVALITGGTGLGQEFDGRSKKEREAFRKGVKGYLDKIFNNYLSKAKDKSLPFVERNKAFEDLYQDIVDLFGYNDKLLTGVFASKSGDVITIFRRENALNGDEITIPIARVYKYANVKYDSSKKEYSKNGKVINGEELEQQFEGNIELYGSDDSRAYITKLGENATKNISMLTDFLITLAEFNTTRFAIQHAKDANFEGKHISKRNGKIVIKVGDYEKSFVNFTDAAVSLNMFMTTERNVKQQNRYSYEDESGNFKLPKSFYIDVKDVTRPVSEEQREVDKGLAAWKEANEIKDRTEVETDEIIQYSGLNEVEKKALRQLNKALDNKLFAPTIIFGGNEYYKTVDENGNEIKKESYGRYVKSSGKIILTNRGIQQASTVPASLIRLLLHENIHRLINEEGVLKGKIGQRRIADIKDIFNQFWDALQKAPNDARKTYLINKFNQFQKDYGKNDIAFVDEFIAEALSDRALRDFLNTVQSKERVVIEKDKTKKTLLQRLLEKIVEIFSEITNINQNTLLAKLHKALGEQQESTLFSGIEESTTETVETKEETNSLVEEELSLTPEEEQDKDVDTRPDEISDEGVSIETSDDDFDFSLYEAFDENEVKSDAFNENREYNLFGVLTANSMSDFIQQVPSDQKAAVASAVANGEFIYMCQ